jgi:hypothetical protein
VSKPPPDDRVRRLAELVERGASVRAAAKAIDVHERTARRWAATSLFHQYIKELRKQSFNRTVDLMTRAAVKWAKRLGEMADEQGVDFADRVKAAHTSFGDLAALWDRAGPRAAGAAGPSGGLAVPGLDTRFEAAPEGDGGEGDPCEPTPE